MIVKLYEYFGAVGILSIVGWAVALVLLALGVRRRMHHAQCLLALGLAVGGWMLARVNSSNVSAIQLDHRDEVTAALKAKQAAEAASELDATATAVKFAEGDPEDQMPDYRKQGKQVRAKGKRAGKAVVAGPDAEEQEAPVRSMREADLLAANRLDRMNLLIARLVLWLAACGVILDYLARLNATVCRWPLPITGHWLDHLFDKTYAVLFKAGAKRGLTPREYAELAVRKGESFVYFGERDPWEGRAWLPRIPLGPWSLWRLPKLDYGDPEAPATGEFVLDAAWFNRCGVVAVRDEDCLPLLDHITSLLTRRYEARAVARRTMHIIWDLPALPLTEELEPLLRIARETNVKVAAWAREPVEAELAALFEEELGAPPKA